LQLFLLYFAETFAGPWFDKFGAKVRLEFCG
jgi:hypothetical protein